MAITLNKVGVEIDGQVYQFYKLTFGFQRRLVEVQSTLRKMLDDIAKKYDIEADSDVINASDKVSETEKLEVARIGLQIEEALKSLFVNKDEAIILENFNSENITELIESLK